LDKLKIKLPDITQNGYKYGNINPALIIYPTQYIITAPHPRFWDHEKQENFMLINDAVIAITGSGQDLNSCHKQTPYLARIFLSSLGSADKPHFSIVH